MSVFDAQRQSFSYTVSGEQLWAWRQKALENAIAHNIPPSEVDWFLQALSPLTRLDLRLATVLTKDWVSLKIPMDDLVSRWEKRVEDRVPVQYLVGETQWREFQMTVSPAVLIPRPETELLIDLATAAAGPSLQQGHWVDLGTGSGAIALGLAAAFPDATVHGVDCSEAALAIARTNIHHNNHDRFTYHGRTLQERIHLHHGSWFSPWTSPVPVSSPMALDKVSPSDAVLPTDAGRQDESPAPSPAFTAMQFNGIVSNPPYIPSEMVLALDPEVTNHEPHLALDGGTDGLDCLRYLINQASTYLCPQGLFLVEMMAGQAPTVAQLIDRHGGYYATEVHADLAGIERFVLARRKASF